MKDTDLDDIEDQEMADSINNIGTMVLGNDANSKFKNQSADSAKIEHKPDR